MSKINEFKVIYFNPDDTDFEKMHEVHINNIERITANIDNKYLSDMLFDRDERLITYIIELRNRLDKAIKYIEVLDKNEFETIDDVIVLDNYLSDLLDILKGEDNEDR